MPDWKESLEAAASSLAVLFWVVGCKTVDPTADYARTTALVREHTGSADVYDPSADDLVEDRVTALLADGLTVEEAVQVALLNNRGFHAAFQEIGASRADVVQSGLLSNPSLGLTVQFPEGGGRSKLTAGFAQQIVDLWQIPVRKRIAEAQLEQTVLSVADQAVRLTADVKRSFYQMMAAEKTGVLAAENVQLMKRTLEVAQARFDAGDVGSVDVNLVRANLIGVQLDSIEVRRNLEESRNGLLRLLGLSRSSAVITLSGIWPEAAELPAGENEILLTALEQRLDARVAALRVHAADAELEKEYRNVFPDIVLGLEGERPDSQGTPGRDVLADTARSSIASGALTAPSIQSRSQRNQERSQIVDMLLGPSLSITLPIWDQNQAQIAKAGYKARQLRAAYEDLLDTISRETADALNALRSSRELVQFFESEALPQSQRSVDSARATYQAGEQSVLVLLDAQETVIARQRAHVNALRDLALAQVGLDRAVGGSVSKRTVPDDAAHSQDVEAGGDQP